LYVIAILVAILILWIVVSQVFGNPIRLVRRRLLSTFLLEHVGALTRLGLPLSQGLDACQADLSSGSREDLMDVQIGLNDGLLLGDALAMVPRESSGLLDFLDELLRRLQLEPSPRLVTPAEAEVLRVGEMSGNLSRAVSIVLSERRRESKLRNWLFAVLIYPIVVLLIVSGLLAAIMTWIVPKFDRMFQEMPVELPDMTRSIVAAKGYPWFFDILILAILLFIFFKLTRSARPHLRRREWLSELRQKLSYLNPLAHGTLRKQGLAELCRELAMLLRVGTPAPRALEALADGTLSPYIRRRLRVAAQFCREGRPIGEALTMAELDPRTAWVLSAFHDEDLPNALEGLADDYAARISSGGIILGRLLPPAIILFLACAVGYVVIAMFLPLIKLMGAMAG